MVMSLVFIPRRAVTSLRVTGTSCVETRIMISIYVSGRVDLTCHVETLSLEDMTPRWRGYVIYYYFHGVMNDYSGFFLMAGMGVAVALHNAKTGVWG